MSEFKAGDRVQSPLGKTGIVVGESPKQLEPGRKAWVIAWDDDTPTYSAFYGDGLALIRDTVTVTVGLPRDVAEATAESMVDWRERLTDGDPKIAVARNAFIDAFSEALR